MNQSTLFVVALGVVIGCDGSKDTFQQKVEPGVVDLLCGHATPADQLQSYYRMCFSVDEAQCVAVMGRAVHECANRLMPATVDGSNAGRFAERIGACAGTQYELELSRQGKQIKSDKCDIAQDVYAKARATSLKP